MDENAEPSTADTSLSRRHALKAGVAGGIGLAAWSGPTITSLGGTPAYAAGCTFVVVIDLISCRNTDQRSECDFGYHTLKNTGLPAGYSVFNNAPEGTCCSENHTPELRFPAGITCAAELVFAGPPSCSKPPKDRDAIIVENFGPSSNGALPILLDCVSPPFDQSTQYSLIAKCNTTGAPEECIT